MQASTRVESTGPKAALYQHLCEQLGELLGQESNFVANAANAAALLFHALPDVNWVGFYVAEGNELILGPFQGKPATARIPFGKGVCGTAARNSQSLVVPDVHKFAGHIACDTESQSEIVVPLLNWGKLIGVLDIDSPSLNRFDEEDKEGIESIASVLVASLVTHDLPDLSEEAAFG